jgi:hypothetical protein
VTQPISAPPITERGGLEAASRRLDDYNDRQQMDEALREQLREDHEVDRQARLGDYNEADAEFSAGVIKAQARAMQIREIMVFSNRVNYNHFYKMPAQVGLQNVPLMIAEMRREGCRLDDIQITFEFKEVV